MTTPAVTLPVGEAAENTDRELWRDDEDKFFSPNRLFVTKGGSIGLDCGGYVIVKPIRDWHALVAIEKRLSDAYVRLRQNIPGALDTPHAPTSDQVYETTEQAALKLAASLPSAELRALSEAHEASPEFDNWECEFGTTLGKCPESNKCVPCSLQRAMPTIRAMLGGEK